MIRKLFLFMMLIVLSVVYQALAQPMETIPYEDWKAAQSPYDPSATREIISLSDDYVEVRVLDTDGTFVIGTADGRQLMYGFPDNIWSSHTNAKLDGNMYSNESGLGDALGWATPSDNPHLVDSSIQSTWAVGNVLIHQIFELVSFSERSAVKIRYTIENNDSQSHEVGLLLEMDTQVASNDQSPIADEFNYSRLIRDFSGEDMPDFWQSYEYRQENELFPGLTGQGDFALGGAIAPDRFAIGQWGTFVGVVWDYTIPNNTEYTDSAVLLWWNPIEIPAGGSVDFTTLYGVGNLNVEVGELTLTMAAPDELEIVNCQFSPNPFTTVVTVNNTGNMTVTEVSATAYPGDGLEFAVGEEATKPVNPPVLGPGESGVVSWDIFVPSDMGGQLATVGIEVESAEIENQRIEYETSLPDIAENWLLPETYHHFGTAGIGETMSWSTSIDNQTPVPIVIESASCDAPDFYLDSSVSPPFQISSCSTPTIPIYFSPTRTGQIHGTLTLIDQNGYSLEVDLWGRGVGAEIEVSDELIDFGDVPVNQSESRYLSITSSGGDTLLITGIQSSGANFIPEFPAEFPFLIVPQASIYAQIRFIPTETLSYQADLTILSNAMEQPLIQVPMVGRGVGSDIILSSDLIDFGDVKLSETGSQILTISHAGEISLEISRIDISHSDFLIDSDISFPRTIHPGEEIDLPMIFAPLQEQVYIESLIVHSDAINSPTALVGLVGRGVMPALTLSNNQQDFGGVEVGERADQSLFLINSGTGALELTEVSISGDPFDFEIPNNVPAFIPERDSMEAILSFSPDAIGNFLGAVQFSSDDLLNPIQELSLTGVGLASLINTMPDEICGFGDVTVGHIGYCSLVIENQGNHPLEIIHVDLTHPEVEISYPALGEFPFQIAAGSLDSIQFRYSPEAVGVLSQQVALHNSSLNEAIKTVTLTGRGVAGDIIASSDFDFGNVPVLISATGSIWLKNRGGAAAMIQSISLTEQIFTLDSPTVPYNLLPGDSVQVTLSATPTEPILYTDLMTLDALDIIGQTPNISVLCQGIAPEMILSDSSRNFGLVPVGDSVYETFEIANTGNDALIVENIGIDIPQFSLGQTTFPLILQVGEAETVTVEFSPDQPEYYQGLMTLHSNGFLYPVQSVDLRGQGGVGELQVSESAYDYGLIHVDSFADWILTLSNNGSVDLTVSEISSDSEEFMVQNPDLYPYDLAPGQSEIATVRFDPTNLGERGGDITIETDRASLRISLSGRAGAQEIDTPEEINFSEVMVGQYAELSGLIRNTGEFDLTIQSVSLTGSDMFLLVNPITDPRVLAPNTELSLTIRYTPTAPSDQDLGTLTVISDDRETPTELIPVSGFASGGQDIEIADATHDFGGLPLTEYRDWFCQIHNAGLYQLTIIDITSSRADYRVMVPISRDMNIILQPNESIDVTIRFQPISGGILPGTISVTSDDYDEPTVILNVSGAGLAPEIDLPATLYDFGQAPVGETVAGQFFILNQGTTDLIIGSIVSSHIEFLISPELVYPHTILPLDAMAVPVLFTPVAEGDVEALILIYNNDNDENPTSMTLQGEGVFGNLNLSATSLDFGIVKVDSTARRIVDLTNAGTGEIVVESIEHDLLAFHADVETPLTIAPGQVHSMTIEFVPTEAGMYHDTLVLTTRRSGTFYIEMNGAGGQPDIHTATDYYDFGSIDVGFAQPGEFLVYNRGLFSLTIEEIVYPQNPFEILFPINLPYVVPAQDSLTIEMRFTPQTTGDFSDAFLILSDDPETPILYIDLWGTGVPLGIDGQPEDIPEHTRLLSNFPDPFSYQTVIPYELAEPAQTTLTIYDMSGRRVKRLIRSDLAAGTYQAKWDGRNDSGVEVSEGIYLCRMTTRGGVTHSVRQVEKIVLIR
ncbi:MAG: hypothetical protein B6244_11650 [Candidatus Cloacimonetes bacterium 4572_55]|nr:MAG: hypothetical protein B6244_11650 [Candidatus Cloacimonetes bacterium 4572_55]